jgi:enoyl-[acyl-carrier protein] reductase I
MPVSRTLETLFDLRKPAERTNKVLVVGVSSKWSLGLAIGEHMYNSGWQTVLTSRRPEKLTAKAPHHDIRFLDYPASMEAINDLTDLTGMVFCLAKTDVTDSSQGGLLGVSEENFLKTIATSSYAFIALVREVQRRNPKLRSVVALTFLGGERVVPGYEVLGVAKAALEHSVRALAAELGHENVRVNGVSAGAVPTTSSRVLPDFRKVHEVLSRQSFLRRGVTAEEVAGATAYLLSDQSGGMTGEILQVNGGLRHTVV